ncbi:MAG: autotransporter assembly complex family protein [Pseudomonadota bacterium]
MATLVATAGCGGGGADDDGLSGPLFDAPSTAISYEIVLTGLPEEEMVALAEGALAVYRQQEDGAQSRAFLKQRAKGDVDILKKILRSRGYYQGTVDIQVMDMPGDPASADADDPAPSSDDEPAEADPESALVEITVTPGSAFTLTGHDLTIEDPSGTAPDLSAAALGSPVGSQAAAADIVGAERAAVDRLQRTGFPYANSGKRRAVADLESAEIEVTTPIDAGPAATFGPLRFNGLEDVRARYLRTYLPWEEGETFDLTKLRAFQQSLIGTDLFESVIVSPPETPPDTAGPAPLVVRVDAEERPFQTLSAGLRYNTDDGPSVTGGYQHRNLFGENETLTVEAELGLQIQRFGVGYREPQYLRPGQDLTASLAFRREEDDAFDDLTVTAFAGLERKLTPLWTVGAGGLLEASLIEDDGEETTAFLGGLPVFAAYDSSDDTLDPTKGIRARADITPFIGLFDDELAPFLQLDTTASTYFDLTGEKKYIFAARGRFASILAEDLDTVPQTRRLYSGGGGSVRGFAQRFIGPLDENNDPTGGLSAVELGGEFRGRIFGDLGVVVFVEAGSVSEEQFPDFNEGVQAAAGVGFRYYSPAGPIRVDVALPINPRDADDAFQLYFSIGQAF